MIDLAGLFNKLDDHIHMGIQIVYEELAARFGMGMTRFIDIVNWSFMLSIPVLFLSTLNHTVFFLVVAIRVMCVIGVHFLIRINPRLPNWYILIVRKDHMYMVMKSFLLINIFIARIGSEDNYTALSCQISALNAFIFIYAVLTVDDEDRIKKRKKKIEESKESSFMIPQAI